MNDFWSFLILKFCMSCLPVPRPWPAVPSKEEWSPCGDQDAQQVHQVWSQVSLCLLHADPHRQQAAGGDGGRVSRCAQINWLFPCNRLKVLTKVHVVHRQSWQPPVWLHWGLPEEQEWDGGVWGCFCYCPHAQLYCQGAGPCCVRLAGYSHFTPQTSFTSAACRVCAGLTGYPNQLHSPLFDSKWSWKQLLAKLFPISMSCTSPVPTKFQTL